MYQYIAEFLFYKFKPVMGTQCIKIITHDMTLIHNLTYFLSQIENEVTLLNRSAI